MVVPLRDKPNTPLSGVTTAAILIWLLTWAALEWRWRKPEVALGPIVEGAAVLFVLAFLLTFPPLVDLL